MLQDTTQLRTWSRAIEVLLIGFKIILPRVRLLKPLSLSHQIMMFTKTQDGHFPAVLPSTWETQLHSLVSFSHTQEF